MGMRRSALPLIRSACEPTTQKATPERTAPNDLAPPRRVFRETGRATTINLILVTYLVSMIVMKTVNVVFTNEEHKKLVDVKGNLSWHDFILKPVEAKK